MTKFLVPRLELVELGLNGFSLLRYEETTSVKRIKTRSEAQTNGLKPIHAGQMGEIGEERKSLAKGTNVTLVHIK